MISLINNDTKIKLLCQVTVCHNSDELAPSHTIARQEVGVNLEPGGGWVPIDSHVVWSLLGMTRGG